MLRKLEVLGTAAVITHTLPPLPPQVTSQVPNPMLTTQLNFLDFRTVLAASIILSQVYPGSLFLHPVCPS